MHQIIQIVIVSEKHVMSQAQNGKNRMYGIFQPPTKGMYNFFITSQAGLQKFLTPLTCRPPPTAGLKMTNPKY